MVEVLVWEFAPFRHGRIGHAAVRCSPDLYISWWPQSALKVLVSGTGATHPDEAADIEKEGGPPLPAVRIHHLDESAIRSWWEGFRGSEDYRFFIQNCATVAALALKAGLRSRRLPQWSAALDSRYHIWKPWELRRFAEDVARA